MIRPNAHICATAMALKPISAYGASKANRITLVHGHKGK